jgi:hypothetical protein
MVTNQQKIDALKILRNRVQSGKTRYLCVGLSMMEEFGTIDQEVATALSDYIKRALGPYAILEQWLSANGFLGDPLYFGMSGKANLDGVRLARLQWIDWMIEQLEVT